MKRLYVKGYIVPDDDKWIYDLLDLDAITHGEIAEFLDTANGEEIELFIDSPGGVVRIGSDVYSELRKYKGKSTSYIIGVSASAATLLMMGADKVVIFPTARIMIHNSSTRAEGDYRDMEHAAKRLKNANNSIINAYQIKTGMSRTELQKLMDEATWMIAQEALDYGFVDEIALNDGEVLENAQIAAVAAQVTSVYGATLDLSKIHEFAEIYKKQKEAEASKEAEPPESEEAAEDETKDESGGGTRPVSDKQKAYFEQVRNKINKRKINMEG